MDFLLAGSKDLGHPSHPGGFGKRTKAETLRMSGHGHRGGGKAVIVAEGSLFSTKAVK
jgi:hypothetical protein